MKRYFPAYHNQDEDHGESAAAREKENQERMAAIDEMLDQFESDGPAISKHTAEQTVSAETPIAAADPIVAAEEVPAEELVAPEELLNAGEVSTANATAAAEDTDSSQEALMAEGGGFGSRMMPEIDQVTRGCGRGHTRRGIRGRAVHRVGARGGTRVRTRGREVRGGGTNGGCTSGSTITLSGGMRLRAGQKALRDIRHYQRLEQLIIPAAPFTRLVQEVIHEVQAAGRGTVSTPYTIEALTLHALQESAEAYLCNLFADTHLCAIHAKRITVQSKDIQLARRLREERH